MPAVPTVASTDPPLSTVVVQEPQNSEEGKSYEAVEPWVSGCVPAPWATECVPIQGTICSNPFDDGDTYNTEDREDTEEQEEDGTNDDGEQGDSSAIENNSDQVSTAEDRARVTRSRNASLPDGVTDTARI